MKNRIIAAIVMMSLFLLNGSCAAIQAAARGDVNGAVAAAANDAAELSAKQQKCEALRASVVTIEEEYQIGSAVALALAAKTSGVFVEISPDLANAMPTAGQKPKPGTGPKTALTTYMNKLGKSLASSSERPGIDWTFVVLDSTTPNAFSAPGGYVFITTALLKSMKNEAQLAAVLAHEIGHVTGRHAIEAYKAGKVAACTSAVVAAHAANAAADQLNLSREFDALLNVARIDLSSASASLIEALTDATIGKLIENGNGPAFEHAADTAAFDILLFAGYDSRELVKVLQALPDGGGFLTPHPSNADRIKTLEDHQKAEYAEFEFGVLKAPALGTEVAAALK